MSAGSGVLSSAMSAFNTGILMKGGLLVGAGVLNEYASYYAGTLVNRFFPSVPLKNTWQKVILDLATAGVTGYASKFVPGVNKYSFYVFLGGVVQGIKDAAQLWVTPHLPAIAGMGGLGDYLTVHNAQQARPLGDYLTVHNAQQARPLGDYLTVHNAQQARPLGAFAEVAVGQELETM